MKHLNRYLAVMFVQRFVVTTFGMVVLLGVLDALSSAELLPAGAGLVDQFRYMGLRMPILFDRILVFALLMALLLTYVTLIRRNELVAIAGAGVSVLGQVRALVPAVVLATIASAAIVDQAAPVATRALESWLGPEAVRDDRQGPQTLWLADDGRLVEIIGLEGDRLTGVTLFERGADDKVVAVSVAEAASAARGGWALEGVRQMRFDGAPLDPPEMWRTVQTPDTLRLLMAVPRNLSLTDLFRLSRMTGSGSLPSDAYLVWFLNRLSLPLIALGFLLITVPIMQHFGRRDGGEISLAIGVGVGFVFMVGDGVFKTLAENGSLSAELSVAAPVGALLLIGGILTLRKTAQG
jgi:lipopolysaccharide export system permease protein